MERSMRFFTFLAAAAPLLMGAGFAALPATAADKTLTVYTYDAFTSDWGPGPAIKQAFEKDCGCTLEYVALDSSIGVLSRLRLEGDSNKADVVLGPDLNVLAEAKQSGLFAAPGVMPEHLALPSAWTGAVLLPFGLVSFPFLSATK